MLEQRNYVIGETTRPKETASERDREREEERKRGRERGEWRKRILPAFAVLYSG